MIVADDTPAGEAARLGMGARLRWTSRQFSSAGTHLGHRYVDSPVIVPDGSPEPPDDPMQVVQGTWPGMRAPHVFPGGDASAHGPSTLDWFGQDRPGFATGTPIRPSLRRRCGNGARPCGCSRCRPGWPRLLHRSRSRSQAVNIRQSST